MRWRCKLSLATGRVTPARVKATRVKATRVTAARVTATRVGQVRVATVTAPVIATGVPAPGGAKQSRSGNRATFDQDCFASLAMTDRARATA